MGMAGGNVGCIDAILHGQELIELTSTPSPPEVLKRLDILA